LLVSINSAREKTDVWRPWSKLEPLPFELQQEIARYVDEGLTAVGIEHVIDPY
jgi:hypothetical protein